MSKNSYAYFKTIIMFASLFFGALTYAQDCDIEITSDSDSRCLNPNSEISKQFRRFYNRPTLSSDFIETQIIITQGLTGYQYEYLKTPHTNDPNILNEPEALKLPYLALSAQIPVASFTKDWFTLSAEGGLNLVLSRQAHLNGAQPSQGIAREDNGASKIVLPSYSGDVANASGTLFMGYQEEQRHGDKIKLGAEIFGLIQLILGDTSLVPVQMKNGRTVHINLVASKENEDTNLLFSGRGGFISAPTGTNIFSAISPRPNAASPHNILRENLEGLYGSISALMDIDLFSVGVNVSGAMSLSQSPQYPEVPGTILMNDGQGEANVIARQLNVELSREFGPYTISLGGQYEQIASQRENALLINYKVENGTYFLETSPGIGRLNIVDDVSGALLTDHADQNYSIYIAVKYNFDEH